MPFSFDGFRKTGRVVHKRVGWLKKLMTREVSNSCNSECHEKSQ